MKVLIRALPESGGGGLPLPEFFGPFFHQVIVPKKVIFYPKLTIFVGFSVIFVIIIIKITKILIKIIMATIIIIISIFFHHTRKTSFLSAGKKGPRCPNWGVGGLANSGNAWIKTFIFCWCLPLEYSYLARHLEHTFQKQIGSDERVPVGFSWLLSRTPLDPMSFSHFS